MKQRNGIFTLCSSSLLSLFLSIPGHSEELYFGAGISSVQLDSDHPSINRQNGSGYYLVIGSRSEQWGLEAEASGGPGFDTGPTPGIYYPEDSADYGAINLGIKYFFLPEKYPALSPWLGAGMGLHFVTWDSFWYNVDGIGYSLSVGADYELDPNWYARFGWTYHDHSSDDTYEYGPYDGTTTLLNFALLYRM